MPASVQPSSCPCMFGWSSRRLQLAAASCPSSSLRTCSRRHCQRRPTLNPPCAAHGCRVCGRPLQQQAGGAATRGTTLAAAAAAEEEQLDAWGEPIGPNEVGILSDDVYLDGMPDALEGRGGEGEGRGIAACRLTLFSAAPVHAPCYGTAHACPPSHPPQATPPTT
jgi:hypothetical protein